MSTKTLPLAPLDPLRRYSIEQARAYLGISRKTLYADIKDDLIVTIKERKRRFVPGSEIVRRSQAPPAATEASAA